MTTQAPATTTTQVYSIYIKTTPQAVWDAITQPEWTERYGYSYRAQYDLRPGGKYVGYAGEEMKQGAAAMGFTVPDMVVDGEVIESDPPNKLVQTWRLVMDPDSAAEGFTRLTYEIKEIPGGATKLTVIHELENAPHLAALVSGKFEDSSAGGGGGWSWVLSGLKSLLETGSSFGPSVG
jgi:uncharacterized protein YndB with AHSA1/START domain